MNLLEFFKSGSGLLLVLLTLVQIAPIKVNPWSAIFKAVGKSINKDVLKMLNTLKDAQEETKERLDEHIRTDDDRNADLHRARILQFNNELLREIPHTREDFIEILSEVDFYEKYCGSHPQYKNNRAVNAVENIKKCYAEGLQKHDFL